MAQENQEAPQEGRASIGSEVNKNADKTDTRRKSSISVVSLWLEVIACFFGLLSIAAMAATLYPHQNKPIPQWPFQISINTLLSIYGFVLKLVIPVVVTSCLGQLQWTWFVRERPLLDLVRYNDAADGAFGSVQWLWSNHIREPLTAFGAIIAIVSIIIDPFIQQLVLYEDCSTVTGATAYIPRTNYFESIGAHMGAFQETIAPGVQNAINAGLFGSAETISAECLTGNCTFPQYTSLGFCSACQDISDEVNVTVVKNSNGSFLMSTLPSGLSTVWEVAVSEYDSLESLETSKQLFAGAISNSGVGIMEFLRGATSFSQNGLNPTTDSAIDGCNSTQANQTLWQCSLANAASCSFEPCIRVYNGSVNEGQLLETVVDSSQTWGQDGAYISSVVDTQCTSSQQNASLAKLGYKLTSRWLGYNSTFLNAQELDNATASNDADAPFPTSLYTRQCVYTIRPTFVNSLWASYLVDFFTGNVTTILTESNTLGELAGPQSLQTLYNNSYTDFQLIESAVQSMSESLTNYMRRNGQVNQSAPATGEVLHSATCLHVRWPWITLPFSLAVATCVLFVLTVIKVSKSNVPRWKTALLPTLFNGPALSPDRKLYTEKDMETQAAKTAIVLDGDSNNGFQLVEASRREEI